MLVRNNGERLSCEWLGPESIIPLLNDKREFLVEKLGLAALFNTESLGDRDPLIEGARLTRRSSCMLRALSREAFLA